MPEIEKGNSPFSPNQPVRPEFFVGRDAQLERIETRGIRQVARGKPVSIFVQGEFGIGKTSFARFAQEIAETKYGLHPVYCSVGGAASLEEVAAAILQATIRSGALDPKKGEKFADLVGKYVGKQTLFGLTLNLEALKQDAPKLTTQFGILDLLTNVKDRLEVDGIFLILDELNGITSDPRFAHLIKSLVDSNAIAAKPLPLLLMLCGVEERRKEMIQQHQPIDRIFDIVDIKPLGEKETALFFETTFTSVNIVIDRGALDTMVYHSAGFPKIMQLIGEAAYWMDKDNRVDSEEVLDAIVDAAEEVGRRYVDQQVYKALRSVDYRSILNKITRREPLEMIFRKSEIASGLTETEKSKLNNFLQKLKKLNVIRSGEEPGEYEFTHPMVRLYIWLKASEADSPST